MSYTGNFLSLFPLTNQLNADMSKMGSISIMDGENHGENHGEHHH